MSKRIRQYMGILAAVAAYYIVHEGAHLITALSYGVFKRINFMGLGIQIDVYADRMTDTQLGVFCLAGPLAALAAGWVLIAMAKPICAVRSKVFKAIMWYTSLALLLLDPVYLGILCDMFGGGDMNGIGLLISEPMARAIFCGIGIINGIAVWKILLPAYSKEFREQ